MLTIEERIQIVHDILVKHRLMRDVAAENQISISLVSSLAKKASRNRMYFKELISGMDEKQRRQELVA